MSATSNSATLADVLQEQLKPTSYDVRWDGSYCHIQRGGKTVHREVSVTLAVHWIDRDMTARERRRAARAPRHGNQRSFG